MSKFDVIQMCKILDGPEALPPVYKETLKNGLQYQVELLRETEHSKILAERYEGEAEFILPDGSRVDILTDEYAIEVDWCHKWAEAVGQAIFYSEMTNRKPGIVLLDKRGVDNARHILRCLIACRAADIELFVEKVDE